MRLPSNSIRRSATFKAWASTSIALRCADSASALAVWAALADAPRYPLDGLDHLHSAAWKAELAAIKMRLKDVAASPPQWLATTATRGDGPRHSGDSPSGSRCRQVELLRSKEATSSCAGTADATFWRSTRGGKTQGPLCLTAEMTQTFQVVSDIRGRVANVPVRLIGGSVESAGAPRCRSAARINWMACSGSVDIVARSVITRMSPTYVSTTPTRRSMHWHSRLTARRRHGSG